MITLDDEIIDMYDEYVRMSGDAVKSADARDAIKGRVVDLLQETERNLDREADLILSRVLRSSRDSRSRTLRRDLDCILASFSEGDGYNDPLLELAFPLGNEAGMDKTLRMWTDEDFVNLTVTRYRVAADSTRAAADLDETTQQIRHAMRVKGAHVLGEIFS